MLLKRFGENDKEQWYELASGERITCNEETIDAFWWRWVNSLNSKRADMGDYIVFEFIQPIEYELAVNK